MMTFEDHVLAWLQHHRPYQDAVKVRLVEGIGDDWVGSTIDGWSETFSVGIHYLRSNGSQGYESVTGTDMESLWSHVTVGGWS